MATQVWLKCNVSPGQFSEEVAVSAHDYQGSAFSLFVSKSNVEHECDQIADGVECEGQLRVMVLDTKDELVLVRLPGRTFENGSTVTVRRSQLLESPEPSRR